MDFAGNEKRQRMAEAEKLRKGWFRIAGLQDGDRTLEQQILGLESYDFADKMVLDLGCAEGLISRYVLERGAKLVHGCEIIDAHLKVATRLCEGLPAQFWRMDLRDFAYWHQKSMRQSKKPLLARYDVVLLLSIIHKLREPLAFLDYAASLSDQLIIRLPGRVLNDERSGYLNCNIPKHLANRFELIAEPKTCLQEWMGWFRRLP